MITRRAWLGAALLAACVSSPRPEPPPLQLPFATDTLRSRVVRAGVTHRFIYAPSGPWAIQVLDVDLGRCYAALALKGGTGAIGRERTSALLANLAKTREVIGGVNADFFLFTPAGVPTGAMITDGRVVTGPSSQPVFGFTADGRPVIATLGVDGVVEVGSRKFSIAGWNRSSTSGLSLFDVAWNSATDTATSAIEVVLAKGRSWRVGSVDTVPAGVSIPRDGGVLIAGRNAPDSLRTALRSLRAGDSVGITMSIGPIHPREAVGGRPILLRDSAIVGAVDTEGQPGFATARHPRTAVGIAQRGRRLLLVTVDGRQPAYSAGMTLRELANLMHALGARDAINLDGGGSTTFVLADPDSAGRLRVANRPSDPMGERPVGNALAIVSGCARR